jgi:hypothetical protein
VLARWGADASRSRFVTRFSPAAWAWAAIAALLLVGAALLAYETRRTTFWADEWNWILTRRGGGLGTFLDPHNSHFSLVPVVIYKLLFAIVGLRHYWPYRGVLIATDLACALLVFVYARSRVGAYLAFLAAALILFFGPGWQDILWPFQMAWLIAIGAGIGALLSLDRRDRLGDVGACVLLGVSLASAGPGLAVAVGMVVEVLQRRRWRDLWIIAIPIGLYALWWVGYQQATFARHAIVLLPRFVFDSAGGVLSSLAGLSGTNVLAGTGSFLTWGAPLLALGLGAMAWRLHRLGSIPPRVLTLLAASLGFWLLTGIGRAYITAGPLVLTATGDESRYLYIGAVLVTLLAVELARGYAPSLRVGLGAGALVAAAIVSNFGPLRDGARLLQSQAQVTDAELGTLNISRAIVKPDYVSHGFIFGIVTARAWFAAEKDLGSQAATPAQIASFPGYPQEAADSQLISIQQLGLKAVNGTSPADHGPAPAIDSVASGTVSTSGGCVTYRPAAYLPAGYGNALALTVPLGGVLIRDDGNVAATVSVRRFSSQFEELGTLAAKASATLQIKPDLAPEPWHVQVSAGAPLIVCALRG